MRKILHLTLFFTLTLSATFAQRRMELLYDHLFSDGHTSRIKSIDFNNSVVILVLEAPMIKVRDESITYHYYSPGGTFDAWRFNPVVYNSNLYMVGGTDGTKRLFSFDGTNVHTTPIPGEAKSSPVVFDGFLYILSEYHGVVQLWRYDGTYISAVPASFSPDVFAQYDLRVAGAHLYLAQHIHPHGVTSGYSVMKRYDGTSVSTLPNFEFFFGVAQIVGINATGEAYIIASSDLTSHRIYYYNGSSISEIYRLASGSYLFGIVWRDQFYFREYSSTGGDALKRVDRHVVVDIPLPASSTYFGLGMVIFQDQLHLPAETGTESQVQAFNGSTFSTVIGVPSRGAGSNPGSLFLRDGKMIFQPGGYDLVVYEYDGASLITITPPTGYVTPHYLGAATCNYVWLVRSIDYYYGSLAKERICPLDLLHPVIPGYLERFSNFTISFSAASRVHTWSDISSEWIMNDDCKEPDCSQPLFLLALTDAENKPAWQQEFDKPFKAAVSVGDKAPLKGTLSSTEKELEDLIVMDHDMVEKGISKIDVSYSSKSEALLLSATTREGLTVLLRATLVNKEGKTIWEKEFTAPFSATIKDKITEQGEMIKFSVLSSNQNITQYGLKSIEVTITNPSRDVINIETMNRKIIDEGEVTVYTYVGQKIMSKRISNATHFQLQLPPHQPGLFLVNIKTKRGHVTNKMVKLK